MPILWQTSQRGWQIEASTRKKIHLILRALSKFGADSPIHSGDIAPGSQTYERQFTYGSIPSHKATATPPSPNAMRVALALALSLSLSPSLPPSQLKEPQFSLVFTPPHNVRSQISWSDVVGEAVGIGWVVDGDE